MPTSPLLRAYDVTSGSEVWARRGDEAFGRVTSGRGLAVAASRVVTIEQINLGSFNPPGPAAVNAFDAATGELLWRRALPDDGVVRWLEAVAVGRSVVVAVGARADDPELLAVEFMVLAYDAATGEPLWSDNFNLAGEYNDAIDVVVKNGRVLVVGRSERAPVKPLENLASVARAYDEKSGRLIWHRVRGPLYLDTKAAALSRNRLVTLAWKGDPLRGVLLARSVASGRKLWQRSLDKGVPHSVDAGVGRVFAYGREELQTVGDTRLVAVDASTGRPLWGVRQPDSDGEQVLAARGRVFTTGALVPQGLSLRAYGVATGRLVWSRDDPAAERGCRMIQHAGRLLVTASGDGEAVLRAFVP